MTHTFYLKNSQKSSGTDNPSLIYFSCSFKEESKKFVYSTGEKLRPSEWSFTSNIPKLKGNKKNKQASSIKRQLDRYSQAFEEIYGLSIKINEKFTSRLLKTHFDSVFKKVSKHRSFFDYYEEFTAEQYSKKVWKKSTLTRYNNIKRLLLDFEKYSGNKLSFSSINDKFYSDYTLFCYDEKNHFTNTFSRNLGLFKTFMHWSVKKKYCYNLSFMDFVKPKRTITKEVALKLNEIEKLLDLEFASTALERSRDIFVFQCLTGMRYGELRFVNKNNTNNGYIELKEEKDVDKEERKIPLVDVSKNILEKYDYTLPLISNQKQNDAIKKVMIKAELDQVVQYSKVQGKTQTIVETTFSKRISTHTARRSFITIMKDKGVPDKQIMSMTGHTDFKTFNSYYKVDDNSKSDSMNLVFGDLKINR